MITYKGLGDMGRLGNQLFEIAAVISHSLKVEDDAVFPKWKYNKFINSPIKEGNVFFNEEWIEPSFQYTPIPLKKNLNLLGYFQSEKYFIDHKQLIIDTFSPNDKMKLYLERFKKLVSGNTCFLHIRRTDYLNIDLPHLDNEFYQTAINIVKADKYIVFSDDIQWCKENMNHLHSNMEFFEGEEDIVDLYVMSMCRHAIIANSTFSYWGSYLNRASDKIVIAPKKWSNDGRSFEDFYLDNWILLENE